MMVTRHTVSLLASAGGRAAFDTVSRTVAEWRGFWQYPMSRASKTGRSCTAMTAVRFAAPLDNMIEKGMKSLREITILSTRSI